MTEEIMVNIPIPDGENMSVTIIDAYIDGTTLYIRVEDEEYRTATGEFPAEATEDNITSRLLLSTICEIKRINPEKLIGKEIEAEINYRGEIGDIYVYDENNPPEIKR